MMEILYSKTWIEWLLILVKLALAFVPVTFILLLIPMERRGAGFIQDRQGPNRSYIKIPFFGKVRLLGWVQNFCDALKLFFKEQYIPASANKVLFNLAPAIPFGLTLLTPCVLPYFASLDFSFGDTVVHIPGANIDTDIGILLMFGLSSLSVFGTVLSGLAAKSKFSFLGALRATATSVSYEVCLGLSMMGMVLLAGTFSVEGLVSWQEQHFWGILVQPVAFFCFLMAAIAETGRPPFDVSEGDPELVAGYHTEYGAMQFGMFYMGEYGHVAINSMLVSFLFFGGYAIPGMTTADVQANLGWVLAALFGIGAFLALAFLHMVYRWLRQFNKGKASNKADINKEYRLYKLLAWTAVPVCIALAIVCGLFVHPEAAVTAFDGTPVYGVGIALGTAAVQFLVLMVKTVFFCWVWIWVRWTLPRFRYDQIMHLGWKILLNIALLNLVITAVVAKLVMGGR